MKAKNIIKGLQNKQDGNLAQKVFENYLKLHNILFFRINDGELYNPSRFRKSFSRRPQPFDYILVLNKRPIFVDVKSLFNNNIPMSIFISRRTTTKQTSTHKQCTNFIKLYQQGVPDCYFAILQKSRLDEFYFNTNKTEIFILSISKILEIHLNNKKNKRIPSIEYTNQPLIESLFNYCY